MSGIPAELRYTEQHEWLREEPEGTWQVGITDHAQEQLGDLVYVELPAAGRTVAAGEACSVVESVKAASDVYSPLAGEIVEVNEALADAPELINSSPYEEGWLFRVRPAEQPDAGKLLTAEAYKGLVEAD